MKIRYFTFIFIFSAIPSRSFSHHEKVLLAHSVGYSILEGGVGVSFHYEDIAKSPLSFSSVKVFAPDGEEVFQEGMTDARGNFLFLPDRDGVWRVEVDDGLGHGAFAKLDFTGGKIMKGGGGDIPLHIKIAGGVGIIWGLAGIFYYIKARKSIKG